jgi:hypothetical protein
MAVVNARDVDAVAAVKEMTGGDAAGAEHGECLAHRAT